MSLPPKLSRHVSDILGPRLTDLVKDASQDPSGAIYIRLAYIEDTETWRQINAEMMNRLADFDVTYKSGFYKFRFSEKKSELPEGQQTITFVDGTGTSVPVPESHQPVVNYADLPVETGLPAIDNKFKTQIEKQPQKLVTLKPWPRMVEFLPLLSTAEKISLKESLNQYGLKHALLALPDGRIIDGHHRWELLEGKVLPEKVEVLDLDDETAFGLGVSLNLDRRQLTPELLKEKREWQRKAALELRGKDVKRTQEEVAKIVGISQKTVSNWYRDENTSNIPRYNACIPDQRLSVPKSEQPKIVERVKAGENQAQVAADYKITQQRVSQILRQAEARKPKPPMDGYHPLPEKKYRCIVIDPPWPMRKIEREVRPDQGQDVNYPTLTIEQIGAIPFKDLMDESGCHIYMWVTHKHLPDGLDLFKKWGIHYQCVLTWVKNVGFTPFSWMYSTEHVLFGRVGNIDLLKLGKRLDFKADVREHSRKPAIFYDLVKEVSPEPRLDMFIREKREGFDQYGNEVDLFDEAPTDAL